MIGQVKFQSVIYLLLNTLLLSIALGCNSQSKTNTSLREESESQPDFFYEEKYVVEDRRGIDDSHSYYEVKSRVSNKYYVLYLDESKSDGGGNYLIVDRLLIPNLDSNQYVETGSFKDKKGEKQLIVAVEEYNGKVLPDPSIKIYDIWIFDKEKEKFVQENENNFHRIHEAYYLKK